MKYDFINNKYTNVYTLKFSELKVKKMSESIASITKEIEATSQDIHVPSMFDDIRSKLQSIVNFIKWKILSSIQSTRRQYLNKKFLIPWFIDNWMLNYYRGLMSKMGDALCNHYFPVIESRLNPACVGFITKYGSKLFFKMMYGKFDFEPDFNIIN